jgi:hypothetical protein
MYDLTKSEDLQKSGKSIGNFLFKQAAELEKNYSFHKAMAVHHAAAAQEHTNHAAALKAHHAGLPDDDVHKGITAAHATHQTAMAGHHDAIAKAHDAHAETMKAEIDAMKAMAADFGVTKAEAPASSMARLLAAARTGAVTAPPTTPTGNVMLDMVQETSAQLMAKTLSLMDTDPEVQQVMREQVLKMVSEAIGKTVVPTAVSAVAPPAPQPERIGIMAVPRTGARPLPDPAAAAAVPLEFAKLFSSEDGDDGRL